MLKISYIVLKKHLKISNTNLARETSNENKIKKDKKIRKMGIKN